MTFDEAALVVRVALFALVGIYLISVWALIGQLQVNCPDLYERLGSPTALFSQLSAGTYRLMLLIIPGYPEFSPRGVRVPLWMARILLPLCLVLMLNPSLLLALARQLSGGS